MDSWKLGYVVEGDEVCVGEGIGGDNVSVWCVLQVVESPGREATVKVLNSTIPDRVQLESTLNTLLGSEVVFNDSSTGSVPHPRGSLVDNLLMNTLGRSDNLNINSTSKTNVVNIFIINIIGGSGGESQLSSPPALPAPSSPNPTRPHRPASAPAPPHLLNGMPFLPPIPSSHTEVPGINQKVPVVSPHLQDSSERPPGWMSPHQQQVSPPPSPPPPLPLKIRATSPQQQQQQQVESTVSQRPAAAPQSRPEPPVEVPVPQPMTPSVAPLNPGGIMLNNNQMLNLLPDFVRATTIPPIVPLYNTSVHTLLGKQPSIIGLLPNKLFHIIRPHLLPSTNITVGGIIRKNLTPEVGGAAVRRPTNTQYQYPPNGTPVVSPPNYVPTNPLPFLRRYGSITFPKQTGSPSSLRPPALGSARSPRPQLNHPQRIPQRTSQRAPQEFVVMNTETLPSSSDDSVLSITDNAANQRSGQQQNEQDDNKDPSETTEKKNKKKNKKPKQKSSLSSIRTMAADAVAAVDSNMNNVMKAVAIGAVPSGIAFATAFWPYWAPFVLGRRRRRDLRRTDSDISHDWLSILTGNKYKGASTEFPAAWFKKKREGVKGRPSMLRPTPGSAKTALHVPGLSEQELLAATTEHSAAVKRSTASTLATTDLNHSIVQVMSSLTDSTSPAKASPLRQPGTILMEDVNQESSPPDMSLVSNFVYSALHEWNDGDANAQTVNEDVESETPLDLDLAGQHHDTHLTMHVSGSGEHLTTPSHASMKPDVLPGSTTTPTTTTPRPGTRRTTFFATTSSRWS